MWFFNFRKKVKNYSYTHKFPSDVKDFFVALRDCHLDNRKEYFDALKKLASLYPDEPLFWLFAGDILTEKNPERALELHREVLFREGVSGVLRSMVLEHIAKDYIAMKQYGKALSVLKDAVKESEYSQAALLLSEVYEIDGNYDLGLEALKKYLSWSDSKNDLLLQHYMAKGVNHFFKSTDENKDQAVKWLKALAKKTDDSLQSLAAEYVIFLLESNLKKSREYLGKLTAMGENYELFGRFMLLKFDNAGEINYGVNGTYRDFFQILLNPNLKYDANGSKITEESVAVNKLLIRNFLPDDEKLLDVLIPDPTLFVCSECGKKMTSVLPVCPSCQKITGRSFSK